MPAQRASRQGRYRDQPSPPRSTRLLVSALVSFLLLIASLSGIFAFECQSSRLSKNATLRFPATPGAEETRLRAQLTAQPDDLTAILALADVLTNSGRYDEATTLYNQAIALHPNDPRIRIAFGRMLLLARHYADAQAELQQAAALAPNDPTPYYFLGQLAEQLPQPNLTQAKAAYATAVALDPSNPYARLAQDRLRALSSSTPPVTSTTPP